MGFIPPMHFLRTHAGLDGKEWARQTGNTGGREADKRQICKMPFVASPQVESCPGIAGLMWKKGEQTRVVTKIAGAKPTPD